jgi:class 3 adenylate cyclase
MNKPVILCVDDEPIVLSSLKAQLRRRFGDSYAVETVDSGEEALVIARDVTTQGGDVPVVVSDHIMPGMKGDELLIELHNRHPRMMKIILTGQASAQAVGNAVNYANLYRYIAKPWDEADLHMTVAEALRSYYQEKQLAEQNTMLREMNENLEETVERRTRELSLEREKSERLLLNILPEQIAIRLKRGDRIIADDFPEITVLFADIKDFTAISSSMPTAEIVRLLNITYSIFDRIASEHRLEKIKTIGDCYMAVAGVPEPSSDHAARAADAALEMMTAICDSYDSGEIPFQIRMGLHTGPAVAGVIGERKFTYDVWGDTVNIASRMEVLGEVSKIHCTPRLYDTLRSRYRFASRGDVDIKGQGIIQTYYLEGKMEMAAAMN